MLAHTLCVHVLLVVCCRTQAKAAKARIMIINPASGPGTAVDANYFNTVADMKAAGEWVWVWELVLNNHSLGTAGKAGGVETTCTLKPSPPRGLYSAHACWH
jgi:hypothetical protein